MAGIFHTVTLPVGRAASRALAWPAQDPGTLRTLTLDCTAWLADAGTTITAPSAFHHRIGIVGMSDQYDPAGDTYNPSEDPPGIGKRLTLIVLAMVLLVVLAAAYSLHGFWWQ